MVVKRFISIALAGLLAIGSINTGSVRAYAADEDLLLEEASFEDSGEELLEEDVEEVTDDAAEEAAEEVVEEVVEEEPAEEEEAPALTEGEEDASLEASVQKYTVKITYYAEDGKTVNTNITAASYEKESGSVLSAGELALATIPDRSDNPKTNYPSRFDGNYDAKWTLIGSSSIVKMNDAGNALEMQTNAKITSSAEIKVKPVYTAKKYKVHYQAKVVNANLSSDQKAALAAQLEAKISAAASSYPVSYEFRDDQPFTLAKAPAEEFYTVKWIKATVAKSGDSWSFTPGTDLTTMYDDNAYSYYPDGTPEDFGFIAAYTFQDNQVVAFTGENTGDNVTYDMPNTANKEYAYVLDSDPSTQLSDYAAGTSDTITLPNATRDGYTFAGWTYQLAGSDEIKAVPSITSGSTTTYKYTKINGESAAVTFIPKWTANTYSLKFSNEIDPDDTQYKVVSNQPTITTITTDKEIKIYAPERTNYDFVAWYIGASYEDGTTPVGGGGSGYIPSNALTYVAKTAKEAAHWTYTLSYDNFSDAAVASSATGGREVTIKAEWALKTNKLDVDLAFGAYNTTAPLPTTAVNPAGTYKLPDIKLGTGGAKKYIFISPAIKEGYDFNGWKVGSTALHEITADDILSTGEYWDATANSGAGAPVEDIKGVQAAAGLYAYQLKQSDTEGLTFVAQFSKKANTKAGIVNISYKEFSDSGSLIEVAGNDSANRTEFTLVEEDGDDVADPTFALVAPKAREGYTFDGWFDSPNYITAVGYTNIAKTGTGPDVWTYTFSQIKDDVDDAVANGITLYAKWTKNAPVSKEITLSFDNTGVTFYDSKGDADNTWKAVKEDEGYTLKASDLPSGVYTAGKLFDGWYLTGVEADQTDATRVGVGYKLAKDELNIDGDSNAMTVKVYPKWKPITYKITYVGSYKGSNKTVVTKEKTKEYAFDKANNFNIGFRSIFTRAEIPEAIEDNFEAWRLSVGAVRYDKASFPVTVDTVIGNFITQTADLKKSSGSAVVEFKLTAEYAVTAEKYKVVFDATPTDADFVFDKYDFANSAYAPQNASDLRKSIEVTYDEDFILSGAEFVRKGYKLSKWNVSIDGADAGSIEKNGKLNLDVMPNSVVTLKAVWTKDKAYTVKIITNGGSLAKGASLPKTYTYENPISLPGLTKKGYALTGYSTNVAATTGDVYSLGKKGSIEEGNVVLYAIFAKRGYTISFDTNGGTYLDDVYAAYDDTVKLSEYITTRPGYKFVNWTTQVNGKAKKYSAKQKISKLADTYTQFVFKANWSPVKYSITYSSGKGAKLAKSAPKSFTPETAKNIIIPEPTRAGYTFNGWIVTGKSYDVPVVDAKNAKGDDIKKLAKQTVEGKEVYALTEGDWGNIKLTADWIETEYTITFKKADGTAIDGTVEALYSAKNINFTEIAADASGLEKSVKGFALSADAKKAAYAIKKNYKMSSIVTAAAKVQDTVDPLDPAKVAITLYAIEEPAKFFVQTVAVSDAGTLSDKTTTFAAKKGTTVSPKKIKGYTWEKTEVSGGTESDYTISNKGVVKIKGKASANKFVITMTYKPSTYKVMIMPNGKGVMYEGATASKKGIAFQADVPYNTDDTITAADATGLTRKGYTLVGFAKTSKGKADAVAKADAEGGLKLSGLKATKGVAKVYAIWKLDGVEHTVVAAPKVTNNDDPEIDIKANLKKAKKVAADYSYDTDSTAYTIVSTYTKSLTLPKLTAPKGFKFVGWELTAGDSSNVTKDKKTGYVKTIKKNVTESLTLTPVYQELTYKLSVNPNGGKYKGKKTTSVLASKVRYSEDISKYLQLLYGADMVKAGSNVNAVALKKNPTKSADFVTYPFLYKTSNVTLYPIWEGKNAENVPAITATYDGSTTITGLKATNLIESSGIAYIIQISKDKSFATIDKQLDIDASDIVSGTYTNATIAGFTAANAYYLRICKVTGDTKGEWVTATATVDVAPTTVSITYVTSTGSGDTLAYTEAITVNTNAVVGEYAKNVGVPSAPGYTSDGKIYTKEVKDGKTTYKEVGKDVKITGSDAFYTLAKVVEQKYYVRLSADNSGYDSSDYYPYINMYKTYEVGKTTFGELGLTKPSINAAYGFTGWYLGGDQITDATGKVLDAKKDVKVSETKQDVSLVAKFSPITYKVQFLYKDDKGEEKIAATEHVVKYGEVFNLPANEFISVPEGKLFDKWSMPSGLKNVGTSVYNLATTQDAVVKAYATFKTSGTVNVKVKFLYASGSKLDTKKIVTGTEEKLFKDVVGTTVSGLEAPKGYTFATIANEGEPAFTTSGTTPSAYVYDDRYEYTYDTDGDGTPEDYEGGYVLAANYSMATIDTVYVPVMPMVYTVAYNAGTGGSGTISSVAGVDYVAGVLDANKKQIVAYDETGKSGDAGFAKAGYKFDSWNTKEDGTGDKIAAGALLSGHVPQDGVNLTLYAQWKPITFTVKFFNNGGTGTIKDITVTYDATGDAIKKAPKADAVTKTGYKLLGWSSAHNATSVTTNTNYEFAPEANIPSTKSGIVDGGVIRVYAVWEAKALSSISVKTKATKMSYYAGDPADLAGLVITATYGDNTTADIAYGTANASDFSAIAIADAESPKTTITYTFGGVSKTCDMNVDAVYKITTSEHATTKEVTCTLTKNQVDVTSTATWSFADTGDSGAAGTFTGNKLRGSAPGAGKVIAKIGSTTVGEKAITLAVYVSE